MMATLTTTLPVGDIWSYEVKWDGYRCMLLSEGASARLISRNLKDLTADYPHVAAAAKSVTHEAVMLDGELVAVDERGRPSFQALQHRRVERAAILFYVFDLLHLGTIDYRRRPLTERRAALDRLTFRAPILRSQGLPGTVKQIESVVRQSGLEGVIAKRVDSIYEQGRRSDTWVKVKFSKRQEFVIGGYKPAGNAFDSVLVGFYDGLTFIYAGKVRAGFTPRSRADVWGQIAKLKIDKCPFVNLPNSVGKSHWGEGITAEDMKSMRWVKPRVVIEVAFTEFTAGGNLRHASFVAVRDDKPATTVSQSS